MSSIGSRIVYPTTKMEAGITLVTITIIVVSYILFTDFFVNCSVLLALLFPLLLLFYCCANMLSRALNTMMLAK